MYVLSLSEIIFFRSFILLILATFLNTPPTLHVCLTFLQQVAILAREILPRTSLRTPLIHFPTQYTCCQAIDR